MSAGPSSDRDRRRRLRISSRVVHLLQGVDVPGALRRSAIGRSAGARSCPQPRSLVQLVDPRRALVAPAGARPAARSRTPPVAGPLAVGYLGNAVLPARLGEVVRTVLVAGASGSSAHRVVGSVVVERVRRPAALCSSICGALASAVIGATGWLPLVGVWASLRPARRCAMPGVGAGSPAHVPGSARPRSRRGSSGSAIPRRRPALGVLGGHAGSCEPRRVALDALISGCSRTALGIDRPGGRAMIVSGHGARARPARRAGLHRRRSSSARSPMAAFAGVPADQALAIAVLAHALTLVPLRRSGGRGRRGPDRPAPARRARHPTRRARRGRRGSRMPSSSRSSSPSTTRARPSSRSCGRSTAGVATPHELVVVYDFDGDTTVPVVDRLHAEMPALARPPQRPRPRRPQRDEGRDRRARPARTSSSRWPTAPTSRRSSIRWSRSPADGADVVAASRYMRGGHQVGGPRLKRTAEPRRGPHPPLVRRRPDPRPDEQLQALLAALPRRDDDREQAGFELALELTVKATLAGRRVAEVPTTWRDRTAGQSNFKLRKWLPHYLHWYRVAIADGSDSGASRGRG